MTSPALNALLAGANPSLDDEMARLVLRHGKKAVKAAAAKHTKMKRGRKRLNDWDLLAPYIAADAQKLLAGDDDPFADPSEYAIAKDVASTITKTLRDYTAAHRRLSGKLAAERKTRALAHAVLVGEATAPYLRTLELCDALEVVLPVEQRSWWSLRASGHRRDLDAYLYRFKAEPDPAETMEGIRAKLQSQELADALSADSPPVRGVLGGGLLGSRSRRG
jgi:hypothetical protein